MSEEERRTSSLEVENICNVNDADTAVIVAVGQSLLHDLLQNFNQSSTSELNDICKQYLMSHAINRDMIYCLLTNKDYTDLEPEKWDLKLTEEFIDKLAPLVGSQSLEFLLELDMTFQDWEQIKHKQSERDLVQLNCDILEAWKQNCYKHNVRPTLRDIGRAFGNIGNHIKIIENTLFD